MIRQRVRRACDPCRKRKVKCDGSFPCDVCSGYGYVCEFKRSDERKKPSKRAHTEPSHSPVFIASPLGELSTTENTRAEAYKSIPNVAADEMPSYMFVEVSNRKSASLAPNAFPESLISRFTTAHSAVAFPRDLSQSLGLSDVPRLHSFAWNTGAREERPPPLGNRVFDQISLQDTLQYANNYFHILHPMFNFLDRSKFTRSCISAWSLKDMPTDVEAIVCGVVALGSLFSSNSSPWAMESNIVEQARVVLDVSVSFPPLQLSLKFVIAWLLRAIYLRCTTRPHLSWMATCNAMHIAEAIGLHQELSNIDVLRERSREVCLKETVARRKTFWIAISLNKLFSMEYGRSPIHLDSVSCTPLESEGETDFTTDFVRLCQFLPKNTHDLKRLGEEKEELTQALKRLTDQPTQHSLLVLLKAEICFAIFRKMRFLHLSLRIAQTQAIITAILAGFREAESLSKVSSKWWNVISVPFHSVCVLIAMDKPAPIGILLNAMKTLRAVVQSYDTHLAREAIQTAERLLQGFHEKKLEEAHWVGEALGVVREGGRSRNGEQLEALQPVPESVSGFDWPSLEEGGLMEVFFN